MRQIRDTSILEIDITNACVHNCSNCSRFCGHHKKTYFMDFETFRRAVDSLVGYEGLVSLIGGEPLLHPEYARFAGYLRKVRGEGKNVLMDDGRCRAIVKDYPAFIKAQRWFQAAVNKGSGWCMFSSVNRKYYDYYEDIADTITDLWLNDHVGTSFHQPILVSRKDLGIGDEEFQKLRENCWLQDYWSANITPKGAFFCEIAGTLDMLFHGPGGKQIEPGWWDRDIMEFSDQFHWCDICGMALHTYSRNANEGVDDVSQTLLKKLEKIGSPKLEKKQVAIFDMEKAKMQDGIGQGMDEAMAKYVTEQERFGGLSEHLKPKGIYLYMEAGPQGGLQRISDFAVKYKGHVSGFCVLTTSECQAACRERLEELDVAYKLVLVQRIPSSAGGRIALAVRELGRQEWLLLGEEGMELPERFAQRVCQYYLNPGYLFVIEHGGTRSVLLSGIASAVKKAGLDRLAVCETLDDVVRLWGRKLCALDDWFEQLPDTDIRYFRRIVCKEYEKDLVFCSALRNKLEEQGVKKGSFVLLLQSAYVYHTIGIWRVLEVLGYQTYVLSSSIFREYFDGMVCGERMLYFDGEGFRYEQQEALRTEIRKQAHFAGTVVPVSRGPSTLKRIDDYTGVLRTAQDITGKILGIINIRRHFVEPEYDIWRD